MYHSGPENLDTTKPHPDVKMRQLVSFKPGVPHSENERLLLEAINTAANFNFTHTTARLRTDVAVLMKQIDEDLGDLHKIFHGLLLEDALGRGSRHTKMMSTMGYVTGEAEPFHAAKLEELRTHPIKTMLGYLEQVIHDSPRRVGVENVYARQALMMLKLNEGPLLGFSTAMHKIIGGNHGLNAETFLKQLTQGKFTYQTPVLTLPNEELSGEYPISTADFQSLMKCCLKATLKDVLDDKQLSTVVESAVDDIMVKIISHEVELRKQQAEKFARALKLDTERARARAESAARIEQREIEREAAAVARTAKLEQEKEKFMLEPRPYTLEGDTKHGPQGIMATLERYGESHVTDMDKKAKATALCKLISDAAHAVDLRKLETGEREKLVSLGQQIFCHGNVMALAKNFGLAEQLTGVQARGYALKQDVSQSNELRKAYNFTTPAVRKAADELMNSDGGAMLIASMLFKQDAFKPYANFVMDATRRIMKAEQRMEARRTEFGVASHEEMLALGEDPKDPYYEAAAEIQTLQGELESKRKEVVAAIGKVLNGTSPNRVQLPLAQAVPAEPQAPQLPIGWAAFVDLKSFQLEASDQGNKYIRISHRVQGTGLSDMHIDLSRNLTVEEAKKRMATFERECQLHSENQQLMRSLLNVFGFDTNGDTLVHNEYGLKVPLTGSEAEQNTALIQARVAFENVQFQRQQVLDAAAEAGIKVIYPGQPNQPIRFTHESLPKGKAMLLGQRGFLSEDDVLALQGLIRKAAPPQELSNALPAADDKNAVGVSEKMRWWPDPQNTLMFFDSSTLFCLSADRNKADDTSWLDVVKASAGLPNITVVIPSVIADWELLHSVPEHDAKGAYTGSTLMYPHNNRRCERMLQSAWRGHVENGQVVIDRKGSTKMLIIETPEDKVFYDRIRTEKKIHGDDVGAFCGAMTREGIFGGNEGERAIERLVNGLPFGNKMTIVSDDLRYFFGDAKNPNNVRATQTNHIGTPIAHISTATYLAAEAHKRKFTYLLESDRKKDDEELEKGTADMQTRKMPDFATISKSLIKYWQEKNNETISLRPHYFCAGDKASEMITSHRSEGAYNNNNRLFEKGHRMLRGATPEMQYGFRELPCVPFREAVMDNDEAEKKPAATAEAPAETDKPVAAQTNEQWVNALSAPKQIAPGAIKPRTASERPGFGGGLGK